MTLIVSLVLTQGDTGEERAGNSSQHHTAAARSKELTAGKETEGLEGGQEHRKLLEGVTAQLNEQRLWAFQGGDSPGRVGQKTSALQRRSGQLFTCLLRTSPGKEP